MLRLIVLNLYQPARHMENLPWSLIQLGTLNGLTPADIVKIALKKTALKGTAHEQIK